MMFLLTVMKLSYTLDPNWQPFPESSMKILTAPKLIERSNKRMNWFANDTF